MTLSIPGVPALLRQPAVSGAFAKLNTASLLVADASIIKQLFNKPKWGVFKGGKSVAAADSVLSFEYRQDTKISDYPQEKGGFQSYNKVGTPYDVRVQLTKGGTEAERAAFLAAIEAATASLDLYDVTTPEKVYKNANIQRFDYRRTAQSGAGLITVDLWLVEVRETVSTEFAKSKQPSGAAKLNGGLVQSAISSAGVKLGVSSGLTKLGIGAVGTRFGGG